MKTLLLLRHAKSSWKDDSLDDHDRPLNKRGKADAPRMARLMREEDVVPDLILSSTAKRARKTAAKVAHESGYEGVIELSGELYLASPLECIRVLNGISDSYQRVLVVGHDPGLELLLQQLTGHDKAMPTAALAEIELPIESWSQLTSETTGSLKRRWKPKLPF